MTTESTTTTDIDETTEVTLESIGPGLVEYIDLALKALLVFAAFAIYTRL